jgi:short subunit dehydrogenase-like uncharacterized protein
MAQMADAEWMIYGAYGFTGRLIAREAKRKHLRPILAGRRAGPIRELASELDLPSRSFDANDPAAVAAALTGIDLVLNCAGPFSATAGPMLEACLAGRTHYLDITGEIDVFVAAHARHAAAQAAGIVVCPGVGFDVVPTDCIAAVLKDALPDTTHLALGFDVNGTPSPGTAKTIVEGLKAGGRVRRNGEIIAVPFAYRTRTIDFGRGEALGVTIPWGDVATAYYSTGIPDIEVYLRSSSSAVFGMRCLNFVKPILHRAAPLLRRLAASTRGPSEDQLRQETSYLWGEVRNAAGALRTARLTTPNGYRLTADAALMAVQTVLERRPPGGYYTPSRLMGARSIERLPGVGAFHIE